MLGVYGAGESDSGSCQMVGFGVGSAELRRQLNLWCHRPYCGRIVLTL
jgi:hypothetical protein